MQLQIEFSPHKESQDIVEGKIEILVVYCATSYPILNYNDILI